MKKIKKTTVFFFSLFLTAHASNYDLPADLKQVAIPYLETQLFLCKTPELALHFINEGKEGVTLGTRVTGEKTFTIRDPQLLLFCTADGFVTFKTLFGDLFLAHRKKKPIRPFVQKIADHFSCTLHSVEGGTAFPFNINAYALQGNVKGTPVLCFFPGNPTPENKADIAAFFGQLLPQDPLASIIVNHLTSPLPRLDD